MSEWVRVKEYATLLEAELDQQTLERAGIPVLIRGPLTGAFGPGFSGPTTQGVTLLVPDDRHDEAVDLVGDE
jgi:hypothetical protein